MAVFVHVIGHLCRGVDLWLRRGLLRCVTTIEEVHDHVGYRWGPFRQVESSPALKGGEDSMTAASTHRLPPPNTATLRLRLPATPG